MINDEDFIDKKLHTILEDAVFFFEESNSIIYEETDDPCVRHEKSTRGSSFARASILNSALLLEATANSCIDTLELPKVLFSKVERGRTIAKFGFYLGTLKTGQTLDKGSLVTQKANDLINQRNKYVHPKHYRSKWEKIDDKTRKVNLGESKYLKLPNSLWHCKHIHAENSLRAAFDFVSYFFRDLCKFNEHQVREIIFDSQDPQQPQKWIDLHYEIKVDVGFLVNVAEVEEGEKKLNEHIANQEKAALSDGDQNA